MISLAAAATQLPDQRPGVSGALPHQLQDPVFRSLLPPRGSGHLLQRSLRIAGHEPAPRPDGQTAEPPDAGRAGGRVRELLQEIPAHSEEGRGGNGGAEQSQRSQGSASNRFCPSLPGEDWLVRASQPPCLSANRVEVFGAEHDPTRNSGDEEGPGETWPGHEDEGLSHQHRQINLMPPANVFTFSCIKIKNIVVF